MDKQQILENLHSSFEHLLVIFNGETLIRTLLYVVSATLIGFAVFMFLLYSSRLPTRKSEQILQTVSTLDSAKSQTTINKLLGRFSKNFLLKFVEIGDSTKYKLQSALDYFHYNVTPEEHFSDALSAGIFVALLSALLMVINPFFAVIGIVLGVLIFKNELDAPVKRLEEVKQNIDYDSAVFCKFIADALKEENRNVIDILTACKESVSSDFKNELEHTLTDLKTGNQEEALVSMSKRLGLSSMTQIVVGLLGVLRGDNQTLYFEMLFEKFHKEELTRIRKKNSTKAGTISKISMLLIPPVVLMIMTGMVLTLVQQFKGNSIL